MRRTTLAIGCAMCTCLATPTAVARPMTSTDVRDLAVLDVPPAWLRDPWSCRGYSAGIPEHGHP